MELSISCIMPIFKEHKVSVNQLLRVIPEALLSHLSANTKVDYYAKVLQGKKLFYLLMYGILENDRLSQRTLEDTFNDPVFKMLFNMDESESIRRSSISERLSKIDSDYFKQIYDCIYNQFAEFYTPADRLKYNLIRVDSTIVSQTCNKLSEGLSHNQTGRLSVKYSTAFDGILPCLSKIFTSSQYGSEDIALPEIVKNHVKEDVDHCNIYVFDRGLQSTRNLKCFSDESIRFIVRAKENRKYMELESLMNQDSDIDLESLILVKDCKVNFYTGMPMTTKKGTIRYKKTLVAKPFRLIIARSKENANKEFWFITNEFDLSAKEITNAYRRRWDIEVFFRFIKQELNFTHLVSLNKNGIEVILYMTLIVAMLILVVSQTV
jgi:hypothetical protein